MRAAHEAVGKLVRLCEERRCRLADLPAEVYESVRPGLAPGVYKVLGVRQRAGGVPQRRLDGAGRGGTAAGACGASGWRTAEREPAGATTHLRQDSAPAGSRWPLVPPWNSASWIISTTATASSTAKTCPCRTLAETYGTPLYVYSKATLLHHLRQLQTGLRRRRAADLLQHQDQRQPAPLPADGRARRRLRRHQRRRAVPRPQGRRHGRQDRLRRRRQDRRRVPLRPWKTTSSCSTSRARPNCTPWPTWPRRWASRPRWPCASTPICRPRRTSRPTPASRASSSASTSTPSSTSPAAWSAIRSVRIVGLHMHLGSPILSTQPYRDGVAKGLVLIEKLREQGHPDQRT